MAVRLTNTLTRRKEELDSLLAPSGSSQENTVRMYACGVTVYDRCHIGHARSLYVFEVIRRHLKFRGYRIRFVRNITDIDDKIINRARELKQDWQDLVAENIASYRQDLAGLGVAPADIEPRATENIPEMIEHIKGLLKKEAAYEADGDVYFSVRKFPEYGKLSGQGVDQMLEAVRIEADPKKRDPLDFALWKKSKEGEPAWPSPWGAGRPGWHIECSTMSAKFLATETLDIHAGGRDLVFPHHENEIAQSEALTGRPFARAWLHHGLLTINGQKMAKSLGNFITIEEALKKYPADDLKMFFLLSHYASGVDFSDEKMAEAHKARERLIIFGQEAEALGEKGAAAAGLNAEGKELLERLAQDFLDAMDDDFNTPRGLACLFLGINEVYQKKGSAGYPALVTAVNRKIQELCAEVFALASLQPEKKLDDDLRQLLEARQDARAKKDFRRADEIRQQLLSRGIVVEDTPQGPRWREA